jgi:phosphoribosylformimino-5-aminoimidazole carboxamide ribotide isomerase
MQIIPAIDIIEGKCVRLTEGDYSRKTDYAISPLEMAKIYEGHGIERLHVVDLDGAKNGKVVNWKSIEEISNQTKLVLDFGGGVKSIDDVNRIKDLGVQYVTIGSIAVQHPDIFAQWLVTIGADNFLLGADVKDEKIMISGWQEASSIELFSFIDEYVKKGIRHIFCTDVSKDGKLEGPSFDLYKRLKDAFPSTHIIASGGISCLEDLHKLKASNCDGAIIGKAIYENKISLKQLTDFISGKK